MKIITWTHNSAVQSCSCNPYLFQNIFYTGTEKVIDIKEIHWIKGTCWIAQVSRNVGVKCTDTNVLSQYTQKAQYSCHAGKGQNKVKTRRRIKLHLCIKINHFKLVTWRQFKVAGQWWINTNAMQIKTSENIHLSLFETQHEKNTSKRTFIIRWSSTVDQTFKENSLLTHCCPSQQQQKLPSPFSFRFNLPGHDAVLTKTTLHNAWTRHQRNRNRNGTEPQFTQKWKSTEQFCWKS